MAWYWTFGDGGNSPAQNPTYTYTVGGTYPVTLTVTTSNGCVNTITKQVQVWSRPIVMFSYTSPTCAGSPVTFTDISTTAHGYITLRAWNFGDGSLQSGPSPSASHTYTNGGIYQVRLTVTTSDNCTDSTIIPVQIQYNPISGFQWSTVDCVLEPVQFQDYSLLFSRIDEFSFRPIPRVCPPDIHGNANKKDSNDHGKGCPFEACSRGPRHYRSRTLELAHKLVLALLGRPNHAFVTGGTNLMREIC